jgi:hypothetical protein
VTLPSASTCAADKPVMLDAAYCGFDSNGSWLNCKQNQSACMMVTNSQAPANPYRGNTQPFRNLNMYGPGAANNGSIGLLVSAPIWTLSGFNISQFGSGIEFGNYAWLDHFIGGSLWNNYADFYCPGGLTDAGEQITLESGQMFNSHYGVYLEGCEVNISNTSIDAISVAPITNLAVYCGWLMTTSRVSPRCPLRVAHWDVVPQSIRQ